MDEIIYGLLKEVRECQQKQNKEIIEQGVCLKNVEVNISEIKQSVSKNTEDVAEHIHRTNLLEENQVEMAETLNDHDKRIEGLEEPVKARAWLKKHYLSIGSMVTALLSLIALISKLLEIW